MIKKITFSLLILIILAGFNSPAKAISSEWPADSDSSPAENLSADDWAQLEVGMAAARYHFTWQAGGAAADGAYQAPNPAQDLAVSFGPSGLGLQSLSDAGMTFNLNPTQLNGAPFMPGRFSADQAQVSMQGNAYQASLENLPSGVRYSFRFSSPVDGDSLTLTCQLSGELVPLLSGEDLLVQRPGGETAFRVGAPTAVDAAGMIFPAAFSLEGSTLVIQVSSLEGPRFPLAVTLRVWSDGVRLTASDAQAGDEMGYAVAVSGDVIVVGARYEDSQGANAGAAYVFQRRQGGGDGWGQVKKLTASDAQDVDYFGASVGISGDVIVVGAFGEDQAGFAAGAVYVFQRNEGSAANWGETAKLIASDAQAADYFGTSVGISGDVIVVGAYGEDTMGFRAGAAYVFQRMAGGDDNWGEVKKLMASDGEQTDFFGATVAVSGDVIVIGAEFEDSAAPSAGAAYVFQRIQGGIDNWGQVKKLTASDAWPSAYFGASVAVSGDVIVVGAVGCQTGGLWTGAAYVFERMAGGDDNWGEVTKLVASDGQEDDEFGYSVAVSGDVIVVGAYGEDAAGSNAGAGYLFHRRLGGPDAWGQTAKLSAINAMDGDHFGWSVAISEDVVVIGAPDGDAGVSDTGAAYVFQDDAEIWEETAKKTASDAASFNSFGKAVAVSGDVVVIGAPYSTGAAYVFQRILGSPNAWGEAKKLTASDNQAGDFFGTSVAISGDVIVIGAPGENGSGLDIGAAYVYERTAGGIDNWGEIRKLTASDAQDEDAFGFSVAVSGDVIVVGANEEDESNSNAGAAYVFQRMQGGNDNWGQVKKLVISSGQENDEFGYAVAVSGDVIVVGTPWVDSAGQSSGAAYIFQRMEGGKDHWGQVRTLAASDAQSMTSFGFSVAVSGEVIVVGAVGSSGTGAAYIFQRLVGGSPDAWEQTARLTASDAQSNDWFGISVAVSGDVAVIGAHKEASIGINAGAAYIFQRTQGGTDAWGQVKKLTASDLNADDYFGYSVGISGDVIAAGAYYKDSYMGAAYLFQPRLTAADLSLTKSDSPATLYTNQPINYTLSVNNLGPEAAENLTVTDTLPEGVTFQSAVGDGWACMETSGTVACTRASLAVGSAPEINLTVLAPSAPGDITNAAVVSSDSIDRNMTNNSDDCLSTIAAQADLSLIKTSDAATVYSLQSISYTLSVNNLGPNTAENVTVTDTLPGEVTYQSAVGDGWSCGEAGGIVTCTRLSLDVGIAPEITLTVLAPSQSGAITNNAIVSSDTNDSDTANNTDNCSIFVLPHADLSLSKTSDASAVNFSQPIIFTLSVSNLGPNTAMNLTVTDTLPGGLTYQSAVGDGWSCGETSGTITCTRASLAVGNAPEIFLTVLAPSTEGQITNWGFILAATPDFNTINNTDQDTLLIQKWNFCFPLIMR